VHGTIDKPVKLSPFLAPNLLTDTNTLSYCEGRFVSRYIPTIGVDYGVKPIKLGDFEVRGSGCGVGSDGLTQTCWACWCWR